MHNTPPAFSEKDLDELINRSFLELDFNKPENEKIAELIAPHVFSTVNPDQQRFRKKLIGKLYLNIFLISSILITGGIAGIILSNTKSEEPQKINIAAPPAHEKIIETVINKRDSEQKNIASNSNPAISHKEIRRRTSSKVQEILINPSIIYNDSIANNLIIQQLKPIYIADTALLLPQEIDSTAVSLKGMNKKKHKHVNKQKKRKRINSGKIKATTRAPD